ncbi:MAG TPA: glycosyltransferase family 2 protein [Candidatus Omnitrophota bacterium]|nr:glycosyltransferase family 2 protein [Candidatus Omnitrophota bacterium]
MRPFSLFIPAYNEEELLENNLVRLVDHVNRFKSPYEIIIISNGSTDRTEWIGNGLSRRFPQIKFFSLPKKGVGRAFKRGLAEFRYDRVVFMDADLSADLAFIDKAVPLLDDHAIVLGTKINGLQDRSLFRKFGSLVFYLSVRLIMGMKYIDYAPGAKAYRREFLMKYLPYIDDHTSFVLNLTYIASIKRLPVAEISISCDDRRKSRFNLMIEALSKYRGLFELRFSRMAGKL